MALSTHYYDHLFNCPSSSSTVSSVSVQPDLYIHVCVGIFIYVYNICILFHEFPPHGSVIKPGPQGTRLAQLEGHTT